MKLSTKVLLRTLTGCGLSLLLASCANAQQLGANIALGKPVTFSATANYPLSTDPDDIKQVNDGQYATATNIWIDKATVGWSAVNPVIITIDLGTEQAISGASFGTAAGRAGVSWPSPIYMAVSSDNKTWNGLGDLVDMSRKNGVPPAEGYAAFRYVTHDLKTHGRYMAFAVANSPYTFVDEIEIYAGDKQWLGAPVGGVVFQSIDDVKAHVAKNQIVAGAKRRLRNDADAVRAQVQAADISAARKSTLLDELKNQETKIDSLTDLPSDFKAILPLNENHQSILAVYGELLAAQGLKPLTIWKQHRYQWLPLLAKPTTKEKPDLNFSMLKNQFRSDALFFTNAGTSAQTIKLKLTNAPKSTQQNWFNVDSVAWTDTKDGDIVTDALIPVESQNGVYSIAVPAGMTRKVWFTVDSSKVAAGNTKSTLEVNNGSEQFQVPVSFDVASIAMNKPRISLGMWDYTNGDGLYGITPQNRDAAIALMRSHYVDTPWASGAALPLPGAEAFDAQGDLKSKLDFSNLDEWIARWPGAKQYFVFPNVGDSFAGTKMNTPEFNVRVGNWAKVLSAHMKGLGLQPKQLGLLLVDEPRNDTHDAIIAAWAKAINATAPELTLFEDPIWMRPDQTKIQEAITEVDILCPMMTRYLQEGEPVKKYYEDLRKQGKELWFYQCTGPTRTYDPQTYFRYQAWHTFAIGGTGQGFWSFGDTGRATSSWNEYAAGGVSFAPAFLDKTTANNSVHWDAVREGMEDFEELAMLQDAIKTSTNTQWKTQAQKVLDDAVKAVTGAWSNDGYAWKAETDVDLADAQLAKVRQTLISGSTF